MVGTLFVGVNVLDCTGDAPFPGEVLVQENRITAVCRGDETLPRDNVRIVDGGVEELSVGVEE